MNPFRTYRLYVRAKLAEYEKLRKRFTAQQAINHAHSDGNACIYEACNLKYHYTLDYRLHKFMEARAWRYVYKRALRKGHGIPTPEAIRQYMDARGYQRRAALNEAHS